VSYEKRKQGVSAEFRGTIVSWNESGFRAGFFLFGTSIKVQRAPHKVGTKWRMTVDGVELDRVEDGEFVGGPPQSANDVSPPPERPPIADLAKLPIVGVWEAPEMRLIIRADGHVSYRRIQGGGSPSLEAPLVSFTERAITVGAGPVAITLRVDEPPHLADGDWRMKIDGVELRRIVAVRGGDRVDLPEPSRLDELCRAGDLTSCSNLGAVYDDGMGIPQDPARAAELYRKACDGQVWIACANLGKLFLDGRGLAKDVSQGNGLLELACRHGSPEGCTGLGFEYDEGIGVKEDDSEAARLLGRGCDGNVAAACARLGALYANGEGVPRDFIQARRLYAKACDGDDTLGCANLGGLYANGLGVQKDVGKAKVLLARACAAGDQESCSATRHLGP
jgi:TPR repeat protein